MQQALAELTGIPRGDQILMCDGARLEGTRPLSAYGLPWVSSGWAPVGGGRGAPAPAAARMGAGGLLRCMVA